MIKKGTQAWYCTCTCFPQTDKKYILKDYINRYIDRKPLTEKPIKRP